MSQTSGVQHQPAAELIVNALQKIKKLAGHRKHADLSDQCQHLIDNIHEVLSPQYAARAAQRLAAAAAATTAAEPPSAPTDQGAPAAEADGSVEPGEQGQVQRTSSTSASGAPAGSNGDAAPTSAADDSATAAAEAAAEAARAAKAKRDADAARLAAAAQATPAPANDLVQRTDSAISDAAAMAVMQVLSMAVDTLRSNIVEAALDLVHKLIAFRYLQGAAHGLPSDKHEDEPPAAADASKLKSAADLAQPAATQVTPQALAVQLICRCDEIPDEGVEVLLLRGLLTASTSLTFTLHGQALLLAVRTCYNLHLMSRSEVNQTTAKAALTQMLNVVFQRMEAGSVKVAVSWALWWGRLIDYCIHIMAVRQATVATRMSAVYCIHKEFPS
eukprot:GHUV01014284.1.p1 GENE.GHUV01014284.1~~GHUV01014284.1.p1  ORF type:complete len:388 (+),score=152.77 GHUV01014284.1:458-1621(+)